MTRLTRLVVSVCLSAGCASEQFDSDPPADGGGGAKRVFMTSVEYLPDFGGPEGADARCSARAASLGGSFKAWIGVQAAPAAGRLSAWDGPYEVVSGATIAQSWSDLTDGWLAGSIDRDENGTLVPALARVWTGTRWDGSWSEKDCSGWSYAGDALVATAGGVATGAPWTDGDDLICDRTARLYCVEQ